MQSLQLFSHKRKMEDTDFYREHIDNLRAKLVDLPCKSPQEQDVLLKLDEERKLATLTIKSGPKNALSGRMIAKLSEVIDALYQWREGLGLLIIGHGGTFCSGSDLVGVRATANQEAGLQLAQIMQYNLMRLQRLPMVSVALIEGYALGGGAELALGADLRLMSQSARIGFVHLKVAICIGWGGGSRLVQLVGPSRALELLTSGRLVGPEEAIRMGLVNGSAESVSEAMDFLTSHTVGPKHTIRALKSMLNSARSMKFDDSLRVEALLFASSWGKEAHLKALDSNIKHKHDHHDGSGDKK